MREVFQAILDALSDFDSLNIAVPLHCTDCNYYTCTQYAVEETLDPQADLKVVNVSLEVQHTYTAKQPFLCMC